MGSSTICPLTFGATPMKFARTVASSVSGKFSHRQMVITIAIRAPTRMSAPRTRPRVRRPVDGGASGSIAGSATKNTPHDERDEDHEGRVHEYPWSQVGIDAGAREELPAEDGPDDTDYQGRHPGWKIGARHRDVLAPPATGQKGADGGRHEVAGVQGSHCAGRSGALGDPDPVSPVLKASVTEASSSCSFVSTSWKRARLNSRRAARRSTRVPRPRR